MADTAKEPLRAVKGMNDILPASVPRTWSTGSPLADTIATTGPGPAPARLAPGGALLLEMYESHLEALPALCLAAGFAALPRRSIPPPPSRPAPPAASGSASMMRESWRAATFASCQARMRFTK